MEANLQVKWMRGKTVSESIRQELIQEIQEFRDKGIRAPHLAVIMAGENPASEIYVRNKMKACEEVGITSETIRMDAGSSTEKIMRKVKELNEDEGTDAFLIQLPLPEGTDEKKILDAVVPDKDADGFHPVNLGKLLLNEHIAAPCTPAGIMEILDYYGIEMEGKKTVVVGRSRIVGKPAAVLALNRNATVTICHSRTRNLAEECRRADILIAAVGVPGFITADFLKPGSVRIDVGTTYITQENVPDWLKNSDSPLKKKLEKRGKVLLGDLRLPETGEVEGYQTPVPGGVGPMTVTMLMKNTVELWKQENQVLIDG